MEFETEQMKQCRILMNGTFFKNTIQVKYHCGVGIILSKAFVASSQNSSDFEKLITEQITINCFTAYFSTSLYSNILEHKIQCVYA